jgi:hypothetical protein
MLSPDKNEKRARLVQNNSMRLVFSSITIFLPTAQEEEKLTTHVHLVDNRTRISQPGEPQSLSLFLETCKEIVLIPTTR